MYAKLPDGSDLCPHLRLAHTRWTRLRGLLGTASLPDGEGLWIKPCSQIHMYFMGYPVDVVFIDERHRVVKAIDSQPVNSISPKVKEAQSVIELPAGTIERTGLKEGDVLDIGGEAGEVEGAYIETAGAVLANVFMAVLYLLFVYRHILVLQKGGHWATATPILIQESTLVFMFLFRRRSKETSPRAIDWLLGIAGTALPLFCRPAEVVSEYWYIGQPIQVLGLTIAALGTLSLGRSIGIVAGNRGVKTGGMHGFVRHPMYLGYIVGYAGYLIVYPTTYNAVIVVGTYVALNLRAVVEEQLLTRDPVYKEYVEKVRYRIIPYVY